MIKGKSVLRDIPKIEEVYRTIELLKSIGVKISWQGNELGVDASGQLNLNKIDRRACAMTRASLFLLGALTRRANNFKVYKTGGCQLGKRTIKPHVFAFAKIRRNRGIFEHYYLVKYGALKANKIVMYESGDTATANAIMAAVLIPGQTVIKMASSNYMVQDLCYFLNKAGAKISGLGTTTLTIAGVKNPPAGRQGLKPVKITPLCRIRLSL